MRTRLLPLMAALFLAACSTSSNATGPEEPPIREPDGQPVTAPGPTTYPAPCPSDYPNCKETTP